MVALPWPDESDTLSVFEAVVSIEDSDLPFDNLSSNFLCGESQALFIQPYQARLEVCWDDSSTSSLHDVESFGGMFDEWLRRCRERAGYAIEQQVQ